MFYLFNFSILDVKKTWLMQRIA